jgi:hypothetical protein
MARIGKIARLPHSLREEVNRRLLDGQGGPEILAWLNAHPEAAVVLRESFGGEPFNAENLSAWRLGGYRDWLARRDKSENLKTLSAFARDLAGSGGHIADGAAAIIAGQILEALEHVAEAPPDDASGEAADPAKRLAQMASAIASLQSAGIARQRLDLDKRKARQKDSALQLAREKFERQTIEAFLKWAKSQEAAAILESGKPRHVQMGLLRELMFGPATSKPPPVIP